MRINFDSLAMFLLVFVRMAGMVALNPLLMRRNVPAAVRAGLSFFLTLLIAPGMNAGLLAGMDDVLLVFAIFRELFLGLALGFVFHFFYYLLFFVGDYLDVGFGMSMAKVFDPGTNIQMSITGNWLSILFMLYILATDSHLILIHLFAASYRFIPAGGSFPMTAVFPEYMLELFVEVFSLVIRLILPFAVAQFTLEAAMGILMKVIPQITIFVINFQLKMGLGLLLLFISAPLIGSFMDQYIVHLFDAMQRAMEVLAAG